MLKLLYEKMVGNELFVPSQILILIKCEIGHCAVEDPGKQHLDQVIKLTSALISHINTLHSSTGWTQKGGEILP